MTLNFAINNCPTYVHHSLCKENKKVLLPYQKQLEWFLQVCVDHSQKLKVGERPDVSVDVVWLDAHSPAAHGAFCKKRNITTLAKDFKILEQFLCFHYPSTKISL